MSSFSFCEKSLAHFSNRLSTKALSLGRHRTSTIGSNSLRRPYGVLIGGKSNLEDQFAHEIFIKSFVLVNFIIKHELGLIQKFQQGFVGGNQTFCPFEIDNLGVITRELIFSEKYILYWVCLPSSKVLYC